MPTLRFADLNPLLAGCHVCRVTIRPGDVWRQHGHDYAEAFWVELGAVRHQTGRSVRLLTAGDIILVRPGQRHELHGSPGGVAMAVNLAFPAACLARLERRYRGLAGWGRGPEPLVRRLGPGVTTVLAAAIEALPERPGDDLARDALLITLLDHLRPPRPEPWHTAPAWLAGPLARCASPPLLTGGIAALARLVRLPAPVLARRISTSIGMTAPDLFARMRREWAERQLAFSDLPIAEIASRAGVSRAGLHALLHRHHGIGPRAYRAACRAALGPG